MASAHAKFTGEVGLCYATSGPGAIHLLNGLYDAKMDHVPVVAIVGQQARTALGAHYQQEVDLQSLFKDVAGGFRRAWPACRAGAPSDRSRRAHRRHRSAPSPASSCRTTCRNWPTKTRRWRTARRTPASAMPARACCRSRAACRQAAAVLNAGKKVAMLVGAGALDATDEVIAVAERLQAGVAKALLGKAALPDDLPCVTGRSACSAPSRRWDMMKDCDTFLMVGSAFPLQRVPAEARQRARRADRHRRHHASASATRWKST